MFSKKKTTIAYTVEKCTQCQKIQKRKFTNGDMLFIESSKCTSCAGITNIEKIFSESIEQ